MAGCSEIFVSVPYKIGGPRVNINYSLKGTVSPDFSPLVFYFKQLFLAPVDKPSNDFDFFGIFAEIFDFSGPLPVSMTPAMQTILLLLDDSFELWMDAIEK